MELEVAVALALALMGHEHLDGDVQLGQLQEELAVAQPLQM